ncbi:MAG TPA: LemA family protein [Gammaproteobacteria bacterium]|nr:LemA family protein [Gammaproteobacteria bacterium]
MTTAYIILGIFLIGFVFYYNKAIRLIESVKNNLKQIDIQLDRRYKVFESLIEVVKKYMDYEKSTLKEVVALRQQANQAKAKGDHSGRATAENKISQVMSGLNVVFEQYPDLKANQNALQLQEEIVSTENKLAFSKQAYNDSIEIYNAFKQSLPQVLIISIISSLNVNFSYWELTDADKQKKEDYSVKL